MTTTKQATNKPNIEQLELRAEEIAAEVETLEQQLKDARAQIARAKQRFAELDEQRKVLAPKVFGGDSKARVELEGVEDEHEEVARATRVARAAEPELARMVEEARERLRAANIEVKRARAQELFNKLKGVKERRDALADQLNEVLQEHSGVYGQYTNAVRQYSQDQANTLVTSQAREYRQWFQRRFGKWF